MASDAMPGMPITVGNHAWVNQDGESVDEIERRFAAFAQGGKVLRRSRGQLME